MYKRQGGLLLRDSLQHLFHTRRQHCCLCRFFGKGWPTGTLGRHLPQDNIGRGYRKKNTRVKCLNVDSLRLERDARTVLGRAISLSRIEPDVTKPSTLQAYSETGILQRMTMTPSLPLWFVHTTREQLLRHKAQWCFFSPRAATRDVATVEHFPS